LWADLCSWTTETGICWADKKRDDFLIIKILTPFKVHLCILWVFVFFLLLCYNLLVFVARSVFLNNRNRDLLVIYGHWTSRFACSLWALGRSVFLNNKNWDLLEVCGHRAPGIEICFSVLPVYEQQKPNRTEPNRTEPKPVGLNQFRFSFDFKILKLIMSVWFIFLCKNRIEPKMITPNYHESKTLHHTHMSHVVHLLINLGNV